MAYTRLGSYHGLKASPIKIPARLGTLTDIANLNGGAPNSLDGKSISSLDRILVKNQSTGSQNGIYVVTTVGTGSNGVWTRSYDASLSEDYFGGVGVYITDGDTLTKTTWTLTNVGAITLNSTSLTFESLGGGGSIVGLTNYYIPKASGSTIIDSAIYEKDGKVGINTDTPSYKLDVKGTTATDMVNSDIGFNINQVADPTSLSGVVSAGGSVDTGDHYYAVTYITVIGESHAFYTNIITTTAGNNTVTLTVPVSSDHRVTSRKIYRTKAGRYVWEEYFLATISDNSTTSYVDTVADSTLTGSMSIVYYKTNTTSRNITIGGSKALTLDSKSTFVGYLAGNSITTGGRNVIVGQSAGDHVTSGSDNTFIGHYAGTDDTIGSANTFIGSYAGIRTSTTSYNTAIGYGGLASDVSGYHNTAIGAFCLNYILTGYNIGIGYQAGYYLGDGTTFLTAVTYSTYIGYIAKASANNITNEIVIGYNAIGKGSNTVTIGHTGITDNYFNGNFYVGNTGTTNKVGINTETPSTTFVVRTGTDEIRFGGVGGRTLSAYSNGSLSNFDFYANSTFFSSNFILDAQKQIQMYKYDSGSAAYTRIYNSITNKFTIEIDNIVRFSIDISGNTAIEGNINFPVTSGTTGIITQGGNNLLHTYGTYNFFLGINAGNTTLTTARENTCIGTQSGRLFSTTSYNTAVGYQSLYTSATNTGENAAFGRQSLMFATGSGNSGLGNTSLGGTGFTGSYNVGIGKDAGRGLTTGSHNTFVGYFAGYSSQLATASYSVAIGDQAYTDKSYQVVLGATNITETILRPHVIITSQTGLTSTSDLYVDGVTTLSGNTAIGGPGTTATLKLNDIPVVVGSGLAKISVGTSTPSSPTTGDLWVDTN